MKKMFIDCDPGIDDTIAIMMAHSNPDVEIVGISSSLGNNKCEITTQNALNIALAIGLKTEIATGADNPIVTELLPYSLFHGANGLGGAIFPESTQQPEKEYAWDLLYKKAVEYKGELVLVTLGALTNIAIALLKYEDLKNYIKEIVMMGGSATFGNNTTYAESNVICDPYACEVVFRSGIHITMVGLDATEQSRLTNEEYNEVFSNKNKLSNELDVMTTHYKNIQSRSNETGLVIHDAAAMAVALNMEIAKTLCVNITVELVKSSANYARTIVSMAENANSKQQTYVVTHIDRKEYIKMLHTTMEFYK